MGKFKKPTLLIVLMLTAVFMSFQNCSPVSFMESSQMRLDTQGPVITFDPLPEERVGYSKGKLELSFFVYDEHAIHSVICEFQEQLYPCNGENDQFKEVLANLKTGEHRFIIHAEDELGNKSENSHPFTVVWDPQEKQKTITAKENAQADILVVMDNSGSMGEEQANMGERMGSLLEKIEKLDWRLGRITTDNTSRYSDKLKNFGSLPFLTSTTPDLLNVFKNGIKMTGGSGLEQGIKSSYLFLEKEAVTPALLRENAVLSVIVVSDADETWQQSGLQFNQTPPSKENIPDNLINLVKEKFPDKVFLFHSIIVKPGDSGCLAQSQNEMYGAKYFELSQKTGGVVGSVCEADYGNQLAQVGQKITESISQVDLDCPAIDFDQDGTKDLWINDEKVEATIEGAHVTLKAPLGAGNHSFKYYCW